MNAGSVPSGTVEAVTSPSFPSAVPPGPPAAPPAGWYPDPERPGWRYWTGATWSVTDAEYRGEPTSTADVAEDPDRPALRGGGMVAVGALVAVVASSIGSLVGVMVDGGALASAASGELELGPATMVGSAVGLWVGMAGTAWVNWLRHGTRGFRVDAALRWHGWRSVWFCAATAIVLRVVSMVVSAVVSVVTGAGDDVVDQVPIADSTSLPVLALVLVVTACVGAPIAEELFFRGALLDTLRARWGTVIAVVVSSVLFTIVHAGSAGLAANAVLIAGIAPVGAALALVRLRRRSLAEAIGVHMVFNATAVVFLLASHGA